MYTDKNTARDEYPWNGMSGVKSKKFDRTVLENQFSFICGTNFDPLTLF